MKSFRILWVISKIHIFNWMKDYRVWSIFIIVGILIHSNLNEVVLFAKKVSYPLTPWIYPFIMSTRIVRMVIWLGFVLLQCDISDRNVNTPYLIIRVGKLRYHIGKIIYLFISTCIYHFYVAVIGIILNITHISFELDWGKVFGTLANDPFILDGTLNTVIIKGGIVNKFMPLHATGITFGLAILTGMFLGLIIYSINMILNSKICGILCGSLFILLDFLFQTVDYLREKGLLVSPVSWSDIQMIDFTGASYKPSLFYILSMFGIIIIGLIILILITSKKSTIEILPKS